MNQYESEIELEIITGQMPVLQGYILFLIGYYQDQEIGTLKITDSTMMENMKYGREALRNTTNVDLGYDVLAWQEYLLENYNFRYMPPVRSDPNFPDFVRKHASFPRRDALVRKLEEQ